LVRREAPQELYEISFQNPREKKGFSASCIELEGCITQGDSLKELHANMQEAL
jgi:predicted RNase H-like HicB family nuclease